MKIKKVKLGTSNLSLYIENAQGLIFNRADRCLYSASPIIIAFVFAIDEGLSKSEAIEEISKNFHYSSSDILSCYQQAKSIYSSSTSSATYADGKYPELVKLKGYTKVEDTNYTSTYVVGDTSFSVACLDTTLKKQITSLLQPIETALKEVYFHIEIRKSSGNDKYLDIYCNDLLIEEKLDPKEVLPLIIDRMQILTFQNSDYCFCFHGAVLQSPQGMLLLPGESGAGKSTLSAFLAMNQYKLCSDEMIALDKYFNVKVIKLPIAVKSGSWDVLSDYYPELKTLPEFFRLDGRRLKYVWPSSFAQSNTLNDYAKIQPLILNPNFRGNIEDNVKAEKLSVIDTISILTEAGYQVGMELDEDKLDKLLGFIECSKRYRVSYNSNKQVERELTSIVGTVNDRD